MTHICNKFGYKSPITIFSIFSIVEYFDFGAAPSPPPPPRWENFVYTFKRVAPLGPLLKQYLNYI